MADAPADADGMGDPADANVMGDFVFGGVEAPDGQALLASERKARLGIHHQPVDPTTVQPQTPVSVEVHVGPDVLIDRVTAYVSTDGRRPCGSRGVPAAGFVVECSPTETLWDPLVWGYVQVWKGAVPGLPSDTHVQYQIEGWAEAGGSHWSRVEKLDGWAEEAAVHSYTVDPSEPPDWAVEAIVYHVFVDRFTGVEGRWLEPAEMNEFTGGTLAGVTQHLDYIEV